MRVAVTCVAVALAVLAMGVAWSRTEDVDARTYADLSRLALAYDYPCSDDLLERVGATLMAAGRGSDARAIAARADSCENSGRRTESHQEDIECRDGHVAKGERLIDSSILTFGGLPTFEEQICRSRASRASGDEAGAYAALRGAWLVNSGFNTSSESKFCLAVELARLRDFRAARLMVGEMQYGGELYAIRALSEIARLSQPNRLLRSR